MKRKIIKINEEKCDGCGLCVSACHEGAIVLVEGKARLVRDDYCDGLGDCLPVCPKGAISFEEREAAAFQEKELKEIHSELRQWPVQIKLVPANAPYFNEADLLIAADCCAYACGAFHQLYMKDRITIIGCPKLDNIDYTEKLFAVIANNNIKSVTVARMEVPCCSGIVHAASTAIKSSGKDMPFDVVTLKTG